MKRKRKNQLKFVHKLLGRQKCRGQIFQGENLIEIDSRQSAKLMVSTYVHELLHFCLPTFSENKILKMERIIAGNLYKLGVRLLAK